MDSTTRRARLLDGKATAAAIRAEVHEECDRLRARGVVPGLTVVLVGDHPASAVYVRNKEKASREAGIRGEVLRLPPSTSEQEVLSVVRRLNTDPDVHGILVQLPLPDGIDAQAVLEAIDPAKDVDGFHPVNAGRLLIGLPGLLPCTPAGVIELLKRHAIPLRGRHACVLGRSNIVGKPMAVLLLREHCTVTVCHSRTEGLAEIAARADLLVAAIGRPEFVTGAFVRPGAVVVDVGIHSVPDPATGRDRLTGDVLAAEAAAKASWLSPVPGGVGPMTIAMLLRNTLEAARTSLERGRPK
jgi:methylenetetrahydrofolate dehydrogenase (NADP+)/methenyltetrahydrofolate cyclohydrolase